MGGLFDLPGLSGFIVMRLDEHNRYNVPLSVCDQRCKTILNYKNTRDSSSQRIFDYKLYNGSLLYCYKIVGQKILEPYCLAV